MEALKDLITLTGYVQEVQLQSPLGLLLFTKAKSNKVDRAFFQAFCSPRILKLVMLRCWQGKLHTWICPGI